MSALSLVPGSLKNRRSLTFFLAIFLTLSILLLSGWHYTPGQRGHLSPGTVIPSAGLHDDPGLSSSCAEVRTKPGSEKLWKAAQQKYEGLMMDKFTVILQTYKRPDELNRTLASLLTNPSPSLLEIIVVWNDLDTAPPADFTSKADPTSASGILVRYRVSKHNSLNEKFRPDPSLRTQAVFLSDDDVFMQPGDLEFAFRTWRQFGHDRIVGPLSRCAVEPLSSDANFLESPWKYTFCSNFPPEDTYSLIITNLAFVHASFLEYYWSEHDPAMETIRAYVDEHFNCEDIALNFVASLLTRSGPLLVAGHEAYVSIKPKVGLSRHKDHIQVRSQCVSDFVNIIGCMSLVNTTGYVQRGVHLIG